MKTVLSSLLSALRERRVVHQSIPVVSESDVERVIRRDFPGEQYDTVNAVLNEYARGKLQRECPRVQLAALKLAQGDLESLRRLLNNAQKDYRDVLIAAEYPTYMREGVFQVRKLLRKKQRQIVDNDWDQYQTWLHK